MLSKLIFTILTAMTLMLAGTATGMADPGDCCADGTGICDGSGDGDGYGNGNGYGYGYGNEAGDKNRDRDKDGSCLTDESDGGNASADLTSDELYWLMFIREEEKLARDSYLVLGDLWSLVIFDNIAVSEQKHMDAMKKQLDCFNLTDPVIDQIGTFSNPVLLTTFDYLITEGSNSMMDGLYVGALIEETDINDIQDAISVTVHMDIVSTYESLMCGSRNHLRAFVRQIEINLGSYTPTVLEADVFWEIAYSDMEQNCGFNKKGQDGN